MNHVGIGYDVHRLVAGRKLILGGVEIPHGKGLEGHSDADVLMHAICDAVLGAIGECDIGTFFPNTDPQWRGAPSLSSGGRAAGRRAQRAHREYRCNNHCAAAEDRPAYWGYEKEHCSST